ncbi:MAG TPA: DUF488 domain-containing protein [Bryobacteraceae bacterium]
MKVFFLPPTPDPRPPAPRAKRALAPDPRPLFGPVFTIGHSTHPLPDFLSLLQAHSIDLLADIRTVPKSRYNPQFNTGALPQPLAEAGIQYVHIPGLGGLRHPRPDSPNSGWRNLSFRGYADYMQTPEFAKSLDELLRLAADHRVAIMCAEAVPWRCHRSLVSDALTVRGVQVLHIMTPQKADPHKLTSFARVHGDHILYPPDTLELFDR